jgi:predicted SprT family Zn-dependent metalloprotease
MEEVKKNTFIDILEKSIVHIESIKDRSIIKEGLSIRSFKNKYSNLDGGSLILFNGELPVKTREYKVLYKCECGVDNLIHLSKYLKKEIMRCVKCRETEEKRFNHSQLLLSKNFKPKNIVKKVYDIKKHIEESTNDFDKESEEFVKNYYEKNLTIDEFNILLNKIVSIDGFDVINNKFDFVPVMKVSNQVKYSQYIVSGDNKISLNNIKYRCENCETVFNTTRRPKTKIKNHKILCSTCSFCNNIFKKRKYKTNFGDVITYQSKSEMLFIETCEKMGIRVLNGEKINYVINGKKRKYYVDFYLPDHGCLIEIKDNHIWHINELKSGVWAKKQKCAEDYCDENNLIYKILFQNEINDFLTSIKI